MTDRKETKERKHNNFPREYHSSFTRYPVRFKNKDGIYRSRDGHIHRVKNVNLRGFVNDDTGAYAAYTASLDSTNPEIGTHRSIIIENVEWEFLLKL